MKFTYKNNLNDLSQLAEDIERFGIRNGLDPDFVFSLNLCLDEIITNIIFYAFPDRNNQDIILEIERSGDEVIATISDKGIPFDPTKEIPHLKREGQTSANKLATGMGGLGIQFIRTIASKLEYTRENEWNHLKICKKISK